MRVLRVSSRGLPSHSMFCTSLNEVHIVLIGRAAMAVIFVARHFMMIVELIFRHFDNAWFSLIVLQVMNCPKLGARSTSYSAIRHVSVSR